MQRLQPSNLSGYNSSGSERMSDQFPAGLRVLMVDDDLTCLKILEQMLKKCMYTVTTCSRATLALSLLREKKGCFDIVLSDVHMPDMDGYKLLELVGLEMDLPVIMMSADGSTSSVMRGVKHGACDYLVKPVRLEELKNIWQHVIRKKCIENKEHEQSGSLEDNDRHKRVCDDTEYASSVNEGTDGNWKVHRKRKELKDEEDEVEQDSEDPSASKKARVVWSVELHHQFVNAVNQLGIEKAVPKRILELMNVQGLTRENVASHLQKFRLYLKRLSAQNQGAMCGSFGGHLEPNGKMNPITNVSMQALAASGQIPPQAFAALHAEILGRHPGTLVVPGVDQPTLLQEALHGSKGNLIESGSAFAQPLMKSQTPFQKQFSRANIPIEDPSASLAWQQSLGTPTPSNIGALNPHGNNMFVPEKPVQLGSSHLLSMQQSCLVTPATGNCFPGRINPVSSSGTCGMSSPNFTGSSILDYSLLSSPNPAQNCMPIGMDPFSDGDVKNIGLLRCSVSNSVPPAASSCPLPIESNANIQSWQMQSSIPMINVNQSGQLSGFTTSPREISYGGAQGASELLDQGASRCPGFVSRGPVSLNRFGAASGSMSSVTGDISQGALCLNDGENMLKQELNSDFIDNPKVGMPVLQHFSQKRLDEPSLQIDLGEGFWVSHWEDYGCHQPVEEAQILVTAHAIVR